MTPGPTKAMSDNQTHRKTTVDIQAVAQKTQQSKSQSGPRKKVGKSVETSVKGISSGSTETKGKDVASTTSSCRAKPPLGRKYNSGETPGRECTVEPSSSTTLASSRPTAHSVAGFYAFGKEAYPTAAIFDEICRDFRSGSCAYGRRCRRIHPRWQGAPKSTEQVKPTEGLLASWDGIGLQNPKLTPENECFESDQRTSGALHGSPLIPTIKPPSSDGTIHSRKSELAWNSQQVSPVLGEKKWDNKVSSSSGNRRSSEGRSLDHPLVELAPYFLDRSDEENPWVVPTHTKNWLHSTDGSYSDDESSACSFDLSATKDSHLAKLTKRIGSSFGSSQSSVVDEPRPSVNKPKNPLPRHHPQICRSWLRGLCQRGYACCFVHGDLEYDVQKEPETPRSPRPKSFSFNPIGVRRQNAEPPLPPYPTPQILPQYWTVSVHDHAKVKMGPGFEVQEVTTGFETPWISLSNVPNRVTTDDIISLLRPFGTVIDTRMPKKCPRPPFVTVRARFSSIAEARQASTQLNGTQAFGVKMTIRLAVRNKLNSNTLLQDTNVLVKWEAPGKVGYAGYPDIERANKAIVAARTPFGEYRVHAAIHVGLPAVGAITVRFYGLPPDTTEQDMRRFADPQDIMWEKVNYTTPLSRATSGIRRMLEASGELLAFDVFPPPYRGGIVRAWAHFATPGAAKVASASIHGRKPVFIGRSRIIARHVQSISYPLSLTTYNVISTDIDVLCASVYNRPQVSISVLHREHTIVVKLSGESLKDLGELKSEFEKISREEIVREDGKVAWDDFLGRPAGAAFTEDLKRAYPDVLIRRDVYRRMVTLLGSSRARATARREILSKLAELRAQQVHIIPLTGQLVGIFMNTDLVELKEKLGPENVSLNLYNHTLVIRGARGTFNAAQQAVNQAQQRYPRACRPNAQDCPVCLSEVTSPIRLRCGHSWCRGCLAGYLTSAIENKYFPLICLGNEAKCTEYIPLSLAQEIMSANEFRAVVDAAFAAHVHSRPDEFHYCPTPDCLQIYRPAPQGTVLQCPACLLRICPHCHVEYHDGFECQDSDGGDILFKEWVKTHDVKHCPGCKIPIERAEGCNHMTCVQCQTHICWVCMETFPRGEGIYGHMRSMHGGIGLPQIF